jgi:hypothetical protein
VTVLLKLPTIIVGFVTLAIAACRFLTSTPGGLRAAIVGAAVLLVGLWLPLDVGGGRGRRRRPRRGVKR